MSIGLWRLRVSAEGSKLVSLARRAARFLLVGGAATAVQYVLLAAAIEWQLLNEIPASIAAFCVASGVNYSLNYYLTFSAASVGIRHQQALPRFLLVAGAGLALNTLCFSLLLPVLHYLLAQVCATAVTLMFNFLLHQFWIYRAEPWKQ
ncbi:GtrA family protein [Microbulbifer celer]|uniref:GtrA family protein n=1 Tax=Microbulbifer celer TaxID=435905 RepID=A0ABW3U342_9GAMM|nr:GtrA family protein [Microbulbifer celer]UFN58196.1 GtrA family protein [Microbulbifer celer]